MKRKKWSELEEQTLISKYSDLLNSGTLSKLKTREKKFKPIAEHVNSLHHLRDPITFPFKWSWRDVSIKVQNMRHQYLGVKQKIRISCNHFNWDDGDIHWENFLNYKQVFGDIELSDHGKDATFGYKGKIGEEGIHDFSEEDDDDEEDSDLGVTDEEGLGGIEGTQEMGFAGFKGKKLRVMGARVLELRDVIARREDERREREWGREERFIENGVEREEREVRREKRFSEREERLCRREMEVEETRVTWAKREVEKRRRMEMEFEDERRRRIKMEERWEEEEMEWRERMVGMQMEHEKAMMQMHAEACQNQLQIIGVVARLVCQFFGTANDGLGGALGGLPLQNLHHPGGLDDGGKQDENSPSEFL